MEDIKYIIARKLKKRARRDFSEDKFIVLVESDQDNKYKCRLLTKEAGEASLGMSSENTEKLSQDKFIESIYQLLFGQLKFSEVEVVEPTYYNILQLGKIEKFDPITSVAIVDDLVIRLEDCWNGSFYQIRQPVIYTSIGVDDDK